MAGGVLAGYPMIDLGVRLVDGSYHEVDSSERAFHFAGSIALKEAAVKARPVLLEPVMGLEIVTPEEFVGEVMGDLNPAAGVKFWVWRARGQARIVRGPGPHGGDVWLFHLHSVVDPGPGNLYPSILPLSKKYHNPYWNACYQDRKRNNRHSDCNQKRDWT